MKEQPSERLLERYLLRELPPADLQAWDDLVAKRPDLQRRLAALEKDNQAILRAHPPQAAAAEIRRRLAEPGPAGRPAARPWWQVAAVPAMAAVMALVVFWPGRWSPLTGLSETRIKGAESQLFIYRLRQGSVEQLKSGARVRVGDLLQIAYLSNRDPYGIIVSLDGGGTVTLHYPERSQDVPALQNRRNTLLPKSYELDAAPDYERFFLVTSATRLDVGAVLQAARELARHKDRAMTAPLPLARVKQASLILRKGE